MDSLGIDIKLLIAQIINFGLFFFIFKKFMAKPFSKFLVDEAKREKDKESIMNDMKKKEEKMIEDQEKTKKQMKKELDEAIKKVKEDAAKLKQKLVAEARLEAETIIVKGKKQIEAERKELEKETKAKILSLSTYMVEKAFVKFLDSNSQKQINKNILKNLSKELN